MPLCIYFNPDFTFSHKESVFWITQIDPGYFAVLYNNKGGTYAPILWFDFTKRVDYVNDFESSHVMNKLSNTYFDALPNKIKSFFLLGGLDAILADT